MDNSSTILNRLNQIKPLLDGLMNSTIEDELKDLSNKISNEKFYLVVLGLFKRGKSSFINSLLGNIVVPTGVVPLTSIITLIEYSEKQSVTIYFEDGQSKKINHGEVNNYIAEEQNPQNLKKVSKVIIYYPSEILKYFTIIDTPGVGSSLEHNTQTTIKFVNKIDAAIFMLSTDIPITQLEVEFLKKLKEIVPKIIFVLNKIDILEKDELEEMIRYDNDVLRNICEKDYKFYLTSSKLAMEGILKNNTELINKSKIETLKNGIFELLEVNKEQILQRSTKNRFIHIIEESEALIKFKINTLKMPTKVLGEKLAQFRNSVVIMYGEKDEFDILLEGKVNQLKDFVADETEKLSKILVENLSNDFNQHSNTNLEKIKTVNLDEFQMEYFNKIQLEFDSMKSKLETEVISRFKGILIKYGEGSNKFLTELINNLSDFSDFKFDSIIEIFDLDVYTGFYYNFNSEPIPIALNNKILRKKLPNLILKRVVLNKLLDNFILKINANTSNIKYDINYRIQESFLQIKYDFKQKLEPVLENLERILNQTLNDKNKIEDEITDELNLYESKLRKLQNIKLQMLV